MECLGHYLDVPQSGPCKRVEEFYREWSHLLLIQKYFPQGHDRNWPIYGYREGSQCQAFGYKRGNAKDTFRVGILSRLDDHSSIWLEQVTKISILDLFTWSN